MIARSFVFLSLTGSVFASGQGTSASIDFGNQVKPILATKCFMCHSQEKRSGGLSLAVYEDVLNGGRSGAAIRPGKSSDSLLMQRVMGEMTPRMPLGGQPLSDAEISTIRSWIDQGARETPKSAAAKPKWEAPLELYCPKVPGVTWKDWTEPLDRFTAAYLSTNGVNKPELVSDTFFARRAYLDIWGLLPTPDELNKFKHDKSTAKRQRLVAKLIANPDKYAENWISFWNDLLRNDEGVNYHSETASRKSITPWLLGALKSNMPYDRFVYKLLDPTDKSDPDGFLIGVNWRGAVSASQTPAMQAAQNAAQIFLGINLKCNSCHDSFISKWKLKDAYSMAGYFSAEEKLQLYRCDVAQQQFAEPAFLYPALNRTPKSGSIADRREAAAATFTDSRNGRLARTIVNRIWERLMGRGIVENPDEMDGEPWSPELLDWLASDFVESHYDLRHLIATIVASRTYQMPSVVSKGEQAHGYVFRGPEVRRVTAEQFSDAIAAITGDWHVYQPPNDPEPKPLAQAGKPAEPAPFLAPKPSVYTREWRVAATSLTRALGRPIRDQVYSTRDNQPTTLQALELENGETLTHWLERGARKMLGELPPEPESLYDRPVKDKGWAPFNVDIRHAEKLWLLVRDGGSYSPDRVEAAWAKAELVGPNGTTLLSSLKPLDETGLRNAPEGEAVRVKTPSRLVYDISGKGFETLRGMAGLENKEVSNDVSPDVRFFIFEDEPNMDRLARVEPELPMPSPKPQTAPRKIVDRVFWYALDRAPSKDERREAEAAISGSPHGGKATPDGLADLLWAISMKPEFQLIY